VEEDEINHIANKENDLIHCYHLHPFGAKENHLNDEVPTIPIRVDGLASIPHATTICRLRDLQLVAHGHHHILHEDA